MDSGLAASRRPGMTTMLQIQHDGQITREAVKPLNQKYFSLPEF
jgi:hypothetical protein